MAVVPAAGRADRTPAEPAVQAASVLFEEYRARIYAYCLHQLSSREEAEDAVQTTFMNAFRGLERGVVPESEQAWLFKIAENVCLSRRRSSWRRGRIESPSDFEVLEELIPSPPRDRADELIGLQDALEAMPENQRRAILLREWQGLSYREIAVELELSQAAVETLIFRARRTLATGLEEPEPAKKRRRMLVGGMNVGTLLGALKELFAGGAAAKAVAVAVAATSTTVAATTLPDRSADPRRDAPAPAQVESRTAPATSGATLRRAPEAARPAATPRVQKPKRAEPAASRPKARPPAAITPAVEESPAPPVVAAPVDTPVPQPAAEPVPQPQPQPQAADPKPPVRKLQSETPKPVEAGPPADKGKPEDKGKPAEAGPPEDKGKPEDSGKPAETGKPEDKGKPAGAGPSADKPEQSRPETGPPAHAAEGKAKGKDK